MKRRRFEATARLLAGLALVALLARPMVSGAARLALDLAGPSPARGHAAVIAHGVVRLPGMPAAWRVVRREAAPFPARTGERDLGLAFILADETPLLVWAAGERWRLAAGEALLTEAGDEPLIAALAEDSAGYYSIELTTAAEVEHLAAGELVLAGDSFDAPGRDRDLDLVRDVLTRDEETRIDADESVLVLVTAGSVAIAAGDESVRLASGQAGVFAGGLRLTGVARTAAFVAAVIGPEIPPLRPPDETPVAPTPTPTGAGPSEPTPETNPSPADFDGDGLSNVDEYLLGTDHRDPDSDDDGFVDGVEAAAGTDPKDSASHP